jgi:hypothetical protein
MCMNGLPLMDDISVLGILPLKLSIILLRIFLFLFHRKNIFHIYVIHVPLIKHINNPFVAPVFKAMNLLNLFTQMCGVQLAILELMDHNTTLFLWITI